MFRQTRKSPTLRLNEQMKSMVAQGLEIHRFGFGESPFLPPADVLNAFRNSEKRKDYTPVKGLPELCERVAEFHSIADGYDIDPEQVVIASGSKILLYDALLLFEKAHVFIPDPAWVSYAPQAKLIRHQVTGVPTSFQQRWRLLPDKLDEYLGQVTDAETSKVLILNYPGNPDGLTYSKSELTELANVLRKHEAWVISDEIYALLHHSGQHISIASIYPERTIVTSGLSKWCGAGGWRLGISILPKGNDALKESFLGIASETFSCAPTPVQVAACTAYQWTDAHRLHLDNQRSILTTIGNEIYDKLVEASINVHAPVGGFYLFLDFSSFREAFDHFGITNDTQLCEKLLNDTGVAILPGSAFGMKEGTFTARLAYVDFDGADAIENIAMIEAGQSHEFLQQYCSHMLTGIDKLIDWLHSLKLARVAV